MEPEIHHDLQVALSSIRPGMDESALAEALSVCPAYRRPNDEYVWDGYCIAGMDPAGRISRITCSSGFRAVSIGEFQIGMTRGALLEACPSLRPTNAEQRYGTEFLEHGTTSEGHNLKALVREDLLIVIELSRGKVRESPILRTAKSIFDRHKAGEWKKIADPDKMIAAWARHSEHLGLDPKLARAYASWLKGASPDKWHQAATAWNWDNGTAPLVWIIRQPSCDLATAMFVYYYADPYYHQRFEGDRSKVPGHSLEGFDLVTEIRRRVSDGQYVRRDIAFDSSGLHDGGPERISSDPAFPDILEGSRIPDGEFNDGFPVELYSEAR